MTSKLIIETHGLTKQYDKFKAVLDLSLAVESKRITGFLGRNGAGKSTTIKMLLGMIRPTAGTARVLGYDITDPAQSLEIRRRIAYVGEDKGLYGYMTVGELIRFTRSFYQDWRPEIEERLLREYQLPLGRKVKKISKGMRTKLALLLALARRPELIILDEPSEGLDPVSTDELLQTMITRLCELNIIQRGESGAWLLSRDLGAVTLGEIYEVMKLRVPTGELCLPQRHDPIGKVAQQALEQLRQPLAGPLSHSIASLLEAPVLPPATKDLP